MSTAIILLLTSYFIGAIPSGYLIAKKLKGIDIRQHGSGNPGAANVYRVVGKWAGWSTFIFDALKGAITVLLAKYLTPQYAYLPMICGFIAICGHMWTIYINFRGGKGVATSAGVFGALLPIPTIIAFIAFILIVWLTGRISPGSIVGAVLLPVISFSVRQYPTAYSIFACVITIIIIYKHIPNIKRMLNKKELAFEDGSKKNANK